MEKENKKPCYPTVANYNVTLILIYNLKLLSNNHFIFFIFSPPWTLTPFHYCLP